ARHCPNGSAASGRCPSRVKEASTSTGTDQASLKRVLVIGSGGSGKTTFAQRLAQRTGLPLIHLDSLYWHPGWEPTLEDEWREKVRGLVRNDAWIIDGNYGGT